MVPLTILAEIERTTKKVDEGIEQFEEYLAKLNASTTAAQKERWEGEMKKEVKRLQRLRDQIKVWQTSNEIKNKEPLNETRRRIEVLMERFKVLEKEIKIKAYSKEGLSAISKVDPKEREKAEVVAWIAAAMDHLKTLIDSNEAELEAIGNTPSSGTGGRRAASGRSSIAVKSPRQRELDAHVARHNHHISKLELVLRMIENEHILPEEVSSLRDFMDDYLENGEVRHRCIHRYTTEP